MTTLENRTTIDVEITVEIRIYGHASPHYTHRLLFVFVQSLTWGSALLVCPSSNSNYYVAPATLDICYTYNQYIVL